jgi:hypothetical protein
MQKIFAVGEKFPLNSPQITQKKLEYLQTEHFFRKKL